MKRTLKLMAVLPFLLPSLFLSSVDSPAAEDPDVPGGSFIVVIDPGHGGGDSGAVGPGNILEKDIALGVAKKLAGALEEKSGCKALLTRDGDSFVTLAERTAFANRVNADVFISIHANAAYRKKASGIETFFLSYEATDEDAARIAAIENNINEEEILGAGEAADDLKAILFDLTETLSRHESSALAESVQMSLVNSLGGENRGVKQAPFLVLSRAAMPAILVEVGFISNPGEEKRLTLAREQERLAASIAEGVISYRNNSIKDSSYGGFRQATQKKD